MDKLPHDILAAIFFCSPLALSDKLAISAVSRRLRRAALGMPLLWSSIQVSSAPELAWLEVLLSRSRGALLDVAIWPDGRDIFGGGQRRWSTVDVARAVAALAPHNARLRTLAVYLLDISVLAPLLCPGLLFERLVEIVVHGGRDNGDYVTFMPFPIAFSAPELRVIDFQIEYPGKCLICAPRLRELILMAVRLDNITDYLTDMQLSGSGVRQRQSHSRHRGVQFRTTEHPVH